MSKCRQVSMSVSLYFFNFPLKVEICVQMEFVAFLKASSLLDEGLTAGTINWTFSMSNGIFSVVDWYSIWWAALW